MTYLSDSTRIESFDIEAEFTRLPADLAYWTEQYAQAYGEWRAAELELERTVATLSLAIRDELHTTTKGRVTGAEVENVLHSVDPYRDARMLELNAETKKVRLHGVVASIQAKKEMLISLGAHMRAEMGNDPMIRNQARIDREVERAKNGA